MGHKKNYRDAHKWSILALLMFVLLPAVLGGADAINTAIANTEITAYTYNNNTAITSFFIHTTKAKAAAEICTTDGIFDAALSAFYNVEYNNETGYNEVLIATGATGTDNTTARNMLFFSMNISAQKLINSNANEIKINIHGLNTNTSAIIYTKIAAISTFFADTTSYSLDDGLTGWDKTATVQIENATLKYTLKLDPAVLSYIASKTNDTYVLKIIITSEDTAKEIFNEGSTIYFKIDILKPHGGLFTLDRYDFIEKIAGLYATVFLIAAIFATGYVNPTHKKILKAPVYGIKKYIKNKRKEKYRKAKQKLYRTYRTSKRRYHYNRKYRRWR